MSDERAERLLDALFREQARSRHYGENYESQASALLAAYMREVQRGQVVLERGSVFPSGLKPWFNVHVRVGMQWDHDPSEDELVQFCDDVVEATNKIMDARAKAAALRGDK